MAGILIIGYGTVGKNLRKELSDRNPDIYDKYKSYESTKPFQFKRYSVAFVCVPTPYSGEDTPCDLFEVKNAVLSHDADVYVIKSTILPGTTDNLKLQTGKRIVYSPEYKGETPNSLNYEFPFTILGGEKSDCDYVVQQIQKCYDGRHKYIVTDSKTAELVKYMENAFLATKVSFCVQFWELAKSLGVSYTELRELFLLDPRVHPSHTLVFENAPYWDSHCLSQDMNAITSAFPCDLLTAIILYNKRNKELYSIN